MAARIAPESIKTAQPAPDLRVRAPAFASDSNAPRLESTVPPTPATESVPPPQPGLAFTAAVLAGQLAPKPETPRELIMRIGRPWAPPASELHLTDKKI